MGFEMIELSDVIVDIAAGPFGSNLKISCFVEDGFPIIDGANLKGYEVTDNITKYVTEEKAQSLCRSIAHRGDVVVTISGTLGQISYIPSNSQYEAYLCSQRQFRVTFDTTKVYVPYLVFYFHTYEGQHKILSFANQTGVPALAQPLKNFKKIQITLPSIEKQKRIAGVIESMNDKIALNQQINRNLEEQAQAIYEERFFSATENVLSDICSYSRERVSVETLSFDNYFSTENMLTNKAGWTIAANLPTTSHVIKCHIGDVLVSNIRPYFKKILYCHHDCGCSNDVLCFTPKSQKLSAFLYGTLYADRFFDFMVAGAKGTKMPRGDKQQIMTYPIKMPSTEELEAYNSLAVPMLQIIYNNTSENIRLANIRDALLPRLMSGEIDVSGIEVLPNSLMEAVADSREQRNLYGPFDSAEDAVASMLED